MNRKNVLDNDRLKSHYEELNLIHQEFSKAFKKQFDRSIPLNEELLDRWERAKQLEFGENTSIYDSAFVFGNPSVGKDVWIGPYTIIDSTGGLTIGDNVTVSVGVQIYTHDNVKKTLLGNDAPIEYDKVSIGRNTYIGPNAVISRGVTIGAFCIIATNSFVNRSFPDNAIIAGSPAKQIGETVIENDNVELKYFKTT